ncbi:hypothetical protein [Geoglobus acetivorans]|uniref:Uncharacterized protein n=1 Tax=Geoglobus acetivorans TaxID=565033 RepID=A0A0A7GG75_GEOAI|nr:hypothetical protein GACE_0889 [Geoglobus acetivorans]
MEKLSEIFGVRIEADNEKLEETYRRLKAILDEVLDRDFSDERNVQNARVVFEAVITAKMQLDAK